MRAALHSLLALLVLLLTARTARAIDEIEESIADLLGEALVARVDVGFSDEEKGLVYLSFGRTF